MAIDAYIKLAGIDGESTSVDHKGEIAVLSWSWGLTATVGTGAGGGGGSGKATPRDFSFVHSYDKASPMLGKFAASSKHIPTAVLSARKSGKGQKDFLKVTMKDVVITSLSPGGSDELAEAVSLAYGEIEFAYKPQDAKGGIGGEVKFDWNVKTGVVT